MKYIYLIRHAKSSWETPNLLDFDRPLNHRGKNDVLLMAQKINTPIDLIISSPAKRTSETSNAFANTLHYPLNEIIFNPKIYEASLNDLTSIINSIPDKHKNVILVGHNPSITSLANYLTCDNLANMPTCSIYKVTLAIDNWNEIIKGTGTKSDFMYPKQFKE